MKKILSAIKMMVMNRVDAACDRAAEKLDASLMAGLRQDGGDK